MMNTKDAPATDVVIVGAGPVGLFLARELLRHGFKVRLVEMHTRQTEHSKALAVMPRTLEVFEMAGLVEPFLAAAHRVTKATVIHEDHVLGSVAIQPRASRYEFVAMIPQDVTEALLLDELRKAGGEVEYGTELVGYATEASSVRVRLRTDGQDVAVNAQYVVGTDGAHSALRRLLGFPFEGGTYPAAFILADIETSSALPDDEMQICPHESGALACFPMSATRRRIVAMVGASEEGEPDLAQVKRLLDVHGLGALEPKRLVWGSRFRIHHRETPRMRIGRAFLAGDSAHIHSPFGAQGMNTGLQDAWNLAWKLRFALQGTAQSALLESYSEERHAVARRVIRLTDGLTRVMASRLPLAQAVRDRAIPILTRLPAFRKRFVAAVSELDVAYGKSKIVEGRGARAGDEPIGTSGSGHLYGRLGRGYVLLVPASSVAAFEELESRYGDEALEVMTHRRSTGITLVRPDGYVAFEAKVADRAALRAMKNLLDGHLVRDRSSAPRVDDNVYAM